MALVLLLLLGAGTAQGEQGAPSAAEAAPISMAGWDVADYNNFLSDQLWGVIVGAIRSAEATRDPTALNQRLPELRALVMDARARCARLPAWSGDASFRDAVLSSLDAMDHVAAVELVALFEVVYRERAVSADVERASALWTGILARLDESDRQVEVTQAAFASKHRLRLYEPELPESPERFVGKGLPPEGVALEPDLYLTLLMSYSNGLALDVLEALERYNGLLALDPEAQREEMLATLASTKAALPALRARVVEAGDWRGDGALHEAALGLMDGLGSALGHLEASAEHWKKRRTRKVVAQINQSVGAANRVTQGAVNNWNKVQEKWFERTQLAAYSAWSEQQLARGAEQEPEQ